MLSSHIKYAVQVLSELAAAGRRGERLTLPAIKRATGLPNSKVLGDVLCMLTSARWVEFTATSYRLRKDLTPLSLYDLCLAVEPDFFLGESHLHEGWPASAGDRYLRMMTLDTKLTLELQDILRATPLTTLFPAGLHGDARKSGRILPRQSPREWMETDTAARP